MIIYYYQAQPSSTCFSILMVQMVPVPSVWLTMACAESSSDELEMNWLQNKAALETVTHFQLEELEGSSGMSSCPLTRGFLRTLGRLIQRPMSLQVCIHATQDLYGLMVKLALKPSCLPLMVNMAVSKKNAQFRFTEESRYEISLLRQISYPSLLQQCYEVHAENERCSIADSGSWCRWCTASRGNMPKHKSDFAPWCVTFRFQPIPTFRSRSTKNCANPAFALVLKEGRGFMLTVMWSELLCQETSLLEGVTFK